MIVRILTALLCALTLTGCVASVAKSMIGPTPYRTEFSVLGSWHGTRAEQIEGVTYRIESTINEMTDPTVMTDYNMLKSAQLASEEGFRYFTIDRDDGAKTQITTLGMRTQPREYDQEVGRTYSAAINITLTNYPTASEQIFEAATVLSNLGPKYISGFKTAPMIAGED